MSWIDDLNNAADAGQLNIIQAQAPQAPQNKKKGNFFTHLLPTIGGTGGGVAGGALGGAAAGTAILPGIGTAAGGLIGALLGGAAGGAAGKIAENKIEGQGAFNGVGGQALEQGVLSAGPIRLLRGAAGATKAVTAGDGLLNAINVAGQKAAAPGVIRTAIANKGAQMEARAGGFGIGEKVPGSNPLGYYDSAAVRQTLKNEGIPTGSPENRLKAVEDALNNRGQQIDLHLGVNNDVLSLATRKKVAADYLKQIESQPGVDDTVRKKAQALADNFVNQTSDLKSLVDFRRGLDSQVINFNQNPDSALVAKQLAARTMRDVLSKQTEKLAPGISGANRSYADLMKAKEYLVGANKAVSDQSQGGGGIVSRLLTNDTAQAVKSRAGGALQKVGAKEGANPFGLKAVSGRTLPLGVLNATAASAPDMQGAQPDQSQLGMDQLPSDPSQLLDSPDQMAAGQQDMTDPSMGGISRQQILAAMTADLQTTGGKHINELKTIYDLSQPPASSLKPVSSQTAKDLSNAQAGLDAIQNLKGLISQDPSLQRKAMISPGAFGGLAGRALGTGEYDAARQQAVDVIARLRTGAAISKNEEARFLRMLPQGFDSPQVANYKLAILQKAFETVANRENVGGSSLQDVLSTLN